jgi:amino acid transporter
LAHEQSSEGLKREVGLLGLMWASEGSIIGSGWLFGALVATEYAGPAALLAWILASVIIILLALVHAELGGLFPVTGGTSRFPYYAFGSFAGASFGWFSYLQARRWRRSRCSRRSSMHRPGRLRTTGSRQTGH